MEETVSLLSQYRSLQLEKVLDFAKFNQYAITHHSTVIEGATLTENETALLLDEGITPAGKPLVHTLMVKDHFNALQLVMNAALGKRTITVEFVQQINAKVMENTGAVINSALGIVDASKGEFRKGNVRAGNAYFVSFDKVPGYTTKMVEQLNQNLLACKTDIEKLKVSFAAHFDLVTIHPFYDGNGRTSRLLMNYIQCLFNLPMAIVHKEDKNAYFTALQEARATSDMQPFYNFMFAQYNKMLLNEINLYKQSFNEKLSPFKGGSLSIFF